MARRTFLRYEDIVRSHLIPALGKQKLAKLKPLDVQAYYDQAQLDGRIDGRGALRASSVRLHHKVLASALHQAVRWQLVARAITDAVVVPTAEKREMRALTIDEQKVLLAAVAQDDRLHYPILLALTTGVRRSELLALRWTDVDLDGAVLTVQRSVEESRRGQQPVRFTSPKNTKGRRVTLEAVTVRGLRRHRAEQAELRLQIGPTFNPDALLFPNIFTGGVWLPDRFSDAFRRLLPKAGIGHLRFHDLRHTHATQLLRDNTHPKVVSERLGHSSIAITLDVYSHVLPVIQAEAADKIDAALGGVIE